MILHKYKKTLRTIGEYLQDITTLCIIAICFYWGMIGACLYDQECYQFFYDNFIFEETNEY